MKQKKVARDWNAVNAHFRRSGPMRDRTKEEDRNACRNFVWDEEEDLHPDEFLAMQCEARDPEAFWNGPECWCSKHRKDKE